MRFAILGPLEVRGDDGTLAAVPGARLRGLLARLILDAGRVVTVQSLVDGLWGEDPPAGAVNAVQSLVSRLRRALPAGVAVESRPAGYLLTAEPADVDATCFEGLAARGRAALAAGDPARAAVLLREAAALWRGGALADVADAPFAAAPAARLAELRLAATEDRFDADLALGRYAEVVGEVTALAGQHPLRERLRGQQMLALNGVGRQADALAVYAETRDALADGLGVDPSPGLAAVHLAVLRGEAAPGPPPPARRAAGGQHGAAATAPRSEPVLRARLTSFVGRDDEVVALRARLAAHRLVTLVGPGGAGKTRLAAESAAAVGLPDGMRFVELAPVRDPMDVPQAVLSALGVRDLSLRTGPRVHRDALARLTDELVDARLLLVLDNCEHLVAAAAALAQTVLDGCPGVRILATSREPLGITGEALHPVPPLALPPPGAGPADALGSAAVRLFADRARAVRPDFAVTDSNVAVVTEICRRLDGMPLAIELAAARLRSLSAGQIAARLSDRFRLLTGGSRTALPRHQTLRAVVGWSWDLLDPAERALARRLSVFAGGATLESAEQVCAGDGLAAADVVDALAALVDKSLVELGPGLSDADGGATYRMLETVRAYGAEQLTAAAEDGTYLARHAAYFVTLAETSEPLLRTAAQVGWVVRLEAEHDNFIAALRWAIESGDGRTALRLAGALSWYWLLRGDRAEAMTWQRAALAGPRGDATELERLTVVAMLAMTATGDGADEVAAIAFAEVLAAMPTPPPDAHPVFFLVPPFAHLVGEDAPLVEADFAPAVAQPDRWGQATTLLLRGFAVENEGDAQGAEADFTEALRIFRELGERWGTANAISSLARLRALAGDHAGAVRRWAEAIELAREVGAWDELEELQVTLGSQLARAGDLAGARTMLAEARRTAHQPGGFWQDLVAEVALGQVDRLTGDLPAAFRRYEVVLRGLDAGNVPTQVRAMALLGYAQAVDEDTDPGDPVGVERVRDLFRSAVLAAVESKDMPILGNTADALAAHALRHGSPAGAAGLLGAAVRLRGLADRGSPDIVRVTAATREVLGDDYPAAYARGFSASRAAILQSLTTALAAP